MEPFNRIWEKVNTFCKRFVFIAFGFLLVGGMSAQTPDTLWHEDFEGDWTADWHVDAGTWEVGTPSSGPGAAYNGDKCAATNISGNYSEGVRTRLIRHTSFIVPSEDQNPYLRFYHWLSCSRDDYVVVQLKETGGEWKTISPKYVSNNGSGAWSVAATYLYNYSGKNVQIGFYFYSHNAGGSVDVSSGSYIDDISMVYGSANLRSPENWDDNVGDWGADGGTWDHGIPTYGPDSAYSPPNCIGTDVNGKYRDGARSRFVSMPFTIPSLNDNPALRFWHWFNFSRDDYGQVQIKEYEKEEWINLENGYYSGSSSNAWTNTYFPLSNYADKKIQIGFYFRAHNAGGSVDESSGWYIDNVKIDGLISDLGIFQQVFSPINNRLLQNYPNPFNPETRIKFGLPKVGHVKLEVFNMLGQRVAVLLDERKPAGYHEVTFDGTELPSGVYYYRIQADEFMQVKKMLLVK